MSSSCLIDIQRMTTAKTEEAFFDVVSTDKKKIESLEAVLYDGPFFNDDDLSLVDTAYVRVTCCVTYLKMKNVLLPWVLGIKRISFSVLERL